MTTTATKITSDQRNQIISALNDMKAQVVAARKRDAEDCSRKWNDSREAKARQLDKQRDDIDALVKILSASSGTISW